MNGSALWYMNIIKPSWAPPAWLFGPVWTVLYILIAISFGAAFYQFYKKNFSSREILPFALNIVFNVAYSPLQFGFKSFTLATIDILLVLGTLIWALMVVWPRKKWIFYTNIPYFLWVLFATVLQLTITFLNHSY